MPALWLAAVLVPSLWIADGFVGWRPRWGVEAYFQRVIDEANIAERFADSKGRQTEDVTGKICDRVDAARLYDLGVTVDDRTAWPAAIGGEPKPFDIWTISEDKGWIRACREGIRHLQIEIDRQTNACTAEVKLWHAGCAI